MPRTTLGPPLALALGLSALFPAGRARAEIDLTVSADGHHFIRKDNGQPFLWLAATHYLLHVQTTREQADWALRTRKDQGFTVIKFELWDGEHDEYQTNAYGQTLRNPDGSPNDAFFQHVDYIVDQAASLGMYVLIVLNKNRYPGDRSFYQWLGRRYKDKTNIFWSTWSGDDVRDQAEGLAKGLTGRDLDWNTDDPAWHSFFVSNYFPNPEDYWSMPWNTLKGSNKPFMDNISWGYGSDPKKPIAITDGAYYPGESYDDGTFHDMRNGLYQVFLSGGYFTYGYYLGWEGQPESFEGDFYSRGTDAITRFAGFFRARAWDRLAPDNGILSGQAGGTLAMRNLDGHGVYVYFSSAGSAAVSSSSMQGQVKAAWFNPTTGETRDEATYDAGGSRDFNTPSGWGDALLYIEPTGNGGSGGSGGNAGSVGSGGTSLRDPENPPGASSGMAYRYYEGSWDALPDFNSLAPAAEGSAPAIDLSPRLRDDQFGLSFHGYVYAPQDGQYTFYTSSDDGSRLYLGSGLVVDNDGLHGTREAQGAIGLKAGWHALRVDFFEQGGDQVLSASYSGPGLDKREIPASALENTGG